MLYKAQKISCKKWFLFQFFKTKIIFNSNSLIKTTNFHDVLKNANLLNRLAMWNQLDCLITELTIPMQCINLDKSLIQSPVSKGIVSKSLLSQYLFSNSISKS